MPQEPIPCSRCEELSRELVAERKERKRLNAEIVRLRIELINLIDLLASK